jgi:hypothetical protein
LRLGKAFVLIDGRPENLNPRVKFPQSDNLPAQLVDATPYNQLI